MPSSRYLVALLVLLAASSTSIGHDLWLDLQKDPASRKSIVVRAVLGAKFPKIDEVKKVEGYREARVIAGAPAGPLADFGAEPTLIGRVTTGQPFAVSVLGPTREIDLKIEEAREYLTEEVGLPPERIAAILEGASPTVHETYSRILKTIRLANDGGVPGGPPFGLPLEIELVKLDPVGPDRWDITFAVLKEGRPVPDAYTRILASARKTHKVRARRGYATISVPRGSPLLIAYIELTSAGRGRYETLWTNLSIIQR